MSDPYLLPCKVTDYKLSQAPGQHPRQWTMTESTREATTGFHINNGLLYLHICEASAEVNDLLAGAREGRGWLAQAGTPPVFVEEEGWVGRVWQKIELSAETLLSLEKVAKVQRDEPTAAEEREATG